MAKLELQNLHKQFSSKIIALQDINLAVAEGEFLTLLGPSGCGKSTLLRLIAGLEQPTAGKVIIGGKNLTFAPPGDRNIAMVFQSYALYPHMTVAQNITTSLRLRRTPPQEIENRLQKVAQKLGLEHLLERQPKQLSGGQRQRVALARAIIRQPDIFLLDEPLSNLDAILREQIRAELKQLFKSQHQPVVYVTHDQTEAMTLSNRIAILQDGILQQIDSPQQVYQQPANQFVASFVGSPQMNILTLKIENQEAVIGNTKIPLSPRHYTGAEIILGIRPEDLYIDTAVREDTIKGNIYLVEELGKEKLISLQVEDSTLSIRALLPRDCQWQTEKISLGFRREHLHWFDYQTGKRL